MFDKYIITPPANVTRTTNVKVEQAGLHDAVRNYSEMRKDAEMKAATLEVERFGADNCVKVLRSENMRQLDTGMIRVLIVYSINGVMHRIDRGFEATCMSGDDMRRAVAEGIAAEVVGQLISSKKI